MLSFIGQRPGKNGNQIYEYTVESPKEASDILERLSESTKTSQVIIRAGKEKWKTSVNEALMLFDQNACDMGNFACMLDEGRIDFSISLDKLRLLASTSVSQDSLSAILGDESDVFTVSDDNLNNDGRNDIAEAAAQADEEPVSHIFEDDYSTFRDATPAEEKKIAAGKMPGTIQPAEPQLNSSIEPDMSATVGIAQWIVVFILSAIPIVNLIMILVWAFSAKTLPSKKNYARAMLIMTIVVTVISILLISVFGLSLSSVLSGANRNATTITYL